MALTKVTGSVIKDSVSLSGNVSVGGTLTYQDVTNVDALGIGTFRTGIKVLAGQVDVGSNIKLGNAGVVTATSFVGSGANLTGIPAQATIANNADNRVITGGSGVNLNGEANLTFNGTRLDISGSAQNQLQFNSTNSDGPNIVFQRSNSNLGYLGSAAANTGGAATDLALRSEANLTFASNGGNERLKITSSGKIGINNSSPNTQLQVTSQTVNATTISTTNCKQLGLWIQSTGGSNTTGHIENGIAFAEGYAGLYSIDAGSGAASSLAFFTGAAAGVTERLRILSTGEMGLGTGTPPTGSFHIHLTETPELNLFSTQHSQGNHCKLNFGIGQSASVSGNTGARIEMNIPNSGGAMNGELKFHTNSGDNLVERVRIPAQTWGLLVTNLSSTGATGGYQTNGVSLRQGGDSTMVHDGGPPLTLTRKTNAGKVLDFYNGTTYAGGIYVNGNNQTAIQQGSDYRLKTDITSMTDGINKVKQLNPIYYKSKEGFDTTTVQNGFLAHEVQSVLPTLVDGEKDAPIDEKGKGYQTLNYAGFTPTAIAAIKELIAKVETLEAEVAALKSS